jgi:capsular polysaccharide export protein
MAHTHDPSWPRPPAPPPRNADSAHRGTKRDFLTEVSRRARLFYAKAPPPSAEGAPWPYRPHDPWALFAEPGGLAHFTLVGRNWLEREAPKPVVVLWGFSGWKPGFIAEYLPEYRTAFARTGRMGPQWLYYVSQMPERPAAFIVWG